MKKSVLIALLLSCFISLQAQSVSLYALLFEPGNQGGTSGTLLFVQVDPLTGTHAVLDTLPVIAVFAASSTFDQVNGEYMFWGLDELAASRLYRMWASEGQLVGNELASETAHELEFDMNSGRLFGLSGDGSTTQLVEIYPDSVSVVTTVGTVNTPSILGGSSTFDATVGTYYFIGVNPGSPLRLYGINVSTGTLTSQPAIAVGLRELQYDQQTDMIYALSQDSLVDRTYLLEVNPFSGAISNVMVVPGLNGPTSGILFGSSVFHQGSGAYLFSAIDSTGALRLYSLDARNGMLIAKPITSGNFIEFEVDNTVYANARYGRTTRLAAGIDMDVSLTPNPSEGDFVLTRGNAGKNARVRVLDSQGRLVDAYMWPQGAFSLTASLQGHPHGTYMVEVMEDQSRWTGRLILQ